ncbi:MAG TPA: YihA family ribosome biogenesis GTP-binding protein [Saprospiraceae bacterium]|nr:YihA family ribosome biogenesis GTP-binding protein [Saprospiraceae bacterium]
MSIHKAQFVGSYPKLAQCPEPKVPEYAFCGRSNVGKSSLINMITEHQKLAKTSSTPGKTQLLNYFLIDDYWYLVDLPGYGFAKVSKQNRKKWWTMITQYVRYRQNLLTVFVLIDGMIKPQNNDIDFINMLGENGVPFAIVFTKVDRVKPKEFKKNRKAFEERLLESWEELPNFFVSSSKTGLGKQDITAYIHSVNKKVEAEFNG